MLMRTCADETSDWIEQAVLIYGPRKAGTTLLQNLLDGVDQLFVYPAELKLKIFIRNESRSNSLVSYYENSRIGTVRSDQFDGACYHRQWKEILEEGRLNTIDQFIRFDVQAAWRAAQVSSISPRIWAAKEVGGPTEVILHRWRSIFPQGKLLMIVRDPRMVVRAVIHDRRRKGIRLSVREIVKQTVDPMAVVQAQSRHINDVGVHLIAYEDLVADTIPTMKSVASFLGIPFSNVLTSPTVFGETQVVRTSSKPTTEVFSSFATWTDGLDSRERMAVSLGAAIGRMKGFEVDYSELRAQLRKKDSASN